MKPIVLLLCAVLAASPAAALPGLGKEPRVTEGLIAVGIAYEIGRVCPTISSRRLRGISYLLQLRGAARDLGYSGSQIDAFIEDNAEKQRLEGIARARLAQMGARSGQPETYCHVGRTEIAKDGAVGRLLK